MESNDFSAPLVNKNYELVKYHDKNGWIYIAIPEIMHERHAFFSWIKVKGTIDGYEVNNFHLMPLPDGIFYFPVRTEICQKIGKKAGDWVHLILYPDHSPADIPNELLNGLNENPTAYQTFLCLSESLQQGIIDWILSASNVESMNDRITKTVNRLSK
jgi:hypothetical protein